MATMTESDWQQLVRDECGQPDKGDPRQVDAYKALDANLVKFWSIYLDKRSLGGLRLQYLWTKRHAVEFLVGQLYQFVDYGDADINESLAGIVEHLHALQQSIEALIEKAETRSAGVRGAAVGVIAVTAPIQPGFGEPNPNSRRLRGDPLRGNPFRP